MTTSEPRMRAAARRVHLNVTVDLNTCGGAEGAGGGGQGVEVGSVDQMPQLPWLNALK